MKKKKDDRRTYWLGVIEEYEGSGKTHEAFARSRRLNVWTFRTWLYRVRAEKRARKASKPAQLVEVKVGNGGGPVLPGAVRVRACNGVTLEFNGVPTPSYLAAVVSELPGAEQ